MKGFTLTFQETRSIQDSMNRPKIEFICLYLDLIINIENIEIILYFKNKTVWSLICNHNNGV